MRQLLLVFVSFVLVLISGKPVFAAPLDNTTCTVLNEQDNPGESSFNEFRRKIEEGYNRPDIYRFCTELIKFDDALNTVKLQAPINIKNENDLDCPAGSGKPAVCGDGWGLTVDGGGSRITIDVTGVGGECAIDVNASRVRLQHIDITATSEQISAQKVICDHGNNNDFTDVKINGVTTEPTPSPTAQPTPSATPLVAPTELTAVMDASSTEDDLKVLLDWAYPTGQTGQTFKVERAPKDATCGTYGEIATTTEANSTYTDDTVDPNTTYCYRVRASRSGVDSDYSNVVEIHTPDGELAAPHDLTATGISETSIFLSWVGTFDFDGVLTTSIERGNSSCEASSFTSIGLANPNIFHFVDTALTAATTYCYRVRVLSDVMGNFSLYSNTVLGTTLMTGATPLPTPTPDVPTPTPTVTPTATPTATPGPTPTATPTASPTPDDVDGDGILNDSDNCPNTPNLDQSDIDGDNIGDLCDEDADGDGKSNNDEIATGTDPLDADTDDDGFNDLTDNCPAVANPDQSDSDGNGTGNLCDSNDPGADIDGDGVVNQDDNCGSVANPDQKDTDEDGTGDACESGSPNPSTNTSTGGCSLGGQVPLWGRMIYAGLGGLMIGVYALRRLREKKK